MNCHISLTVSPVGQADRHVHGDGRDRPIGPRPGHQRLDVASDVSTSDGLVKSDRDPAALARINTQHPAVTHTTTIPHIATVGPCPARKLPPTSPHRSG